MNRHICYEVCNTNLRKYKSSGEWKSTWFPQASLGKLKMNGMGRRKGENEVLSHHTHMLYSLKSERNISKKFNEKKFKSEQVKFTK
jgi:L-fucose isomerase-like protein